MAKITFTIATYDAAVVSNYDNIVTIAHCGY